MSLQALKIMSEEFGDARKILDETEASDTLKEFFETIRKHIEYRIEKECLDQPDPNFCGLCGQIEAECTGSGFDDGIQAHDFTPNDDGYFDEEPDGCTLKEEPGGLEVRDGEYIGCVLFEPARSGHMPDEVHSAKDDDGHFDDEVDGRTLKEI